MMILKNNLFFYSLIVLLVVAVSAGSDEQLQQPRKYLRSLQTQSPTTNSTTTTISGASGLTETNCEEQDAAGEGWCRMVQGYRWDGSECLPVFGCDCVGADCGSIYEFHLNCVMAYQTCGTTPLPAPAPTTAPTLI